MKKQIKSAVANVEASAEVSPKLDLTTRTMKDLTVRSALRAGMRCAGCTCKQTNVCTTDGCT